MRKVKDHSESRDTEQVQLRASLDRAHRTNRALLSNPEQLGLEATDLQHLLPASLSQTKCGVLDPFKSVFGWLFRGEHGGVPSLILRFRKPKHHHNFIHTLQTYHKLCSARRSLVPRKN